VLNLIAATDNYCRVLQILYATPFFSRYLKVVTYNFRVSHWRHICNFTNLASMWNSEIMSDIFQVMSDIFQVVKIVWNGNHAQNRSWKSCNY